MGKASPFILALYLSKVTKPFCFILSFRVPAFVLTFTLICQSSNEEVSVKPVVA